MPLHVLDNLTNLSDTAIARSNIGLGAEDSPAFGGISTSGPETLIAGINFTVDTDNTVIGSTNTIDLTAPTINLNATSGVAVSGNLTLNGNLTTSGTITSPEYTVTNTNGDISTTKSVTTWEFGTKTFSVNTQATTPRGIDFNNTGTRVFVLNSTAGAIGVYQYDLSPSSPWDITTAVYNSVSKSITGVPVGIKFSTDGLYMFISNDTGDTVVRYTLVNPWDLNTVSVNPDQTYILTNVTNGVSTLTVQRGIDFSHDGTRMYVTDDNQNSVYQFNLVTPWSVNTAVYSGNAINVNSMVGESLPQHAVISSDGTRLIIIGQTTDRIWEYTLPTPYSLAGAFVHGWMRVLLTSTTVVNTPVPVFSETNSTGLYYNSIANKCFFIGITSLRIQEIDVTPQILITGKRPVILGNDTGTGSRMVRMNSLYITDSTSLSSQATGALIVNGGISCNGNMAVAGTCAAAGFQAGTTYGVFWSSSTSINAPSNGILRISNNAGNDFARLQFGGTTAGFPAIRRNGSGIDIVDAANADYTSLAAGTFVTNRNIVTQTGDFTISGTDAGKYIRLNRASGVQTITLTGAGISEGHEFMFYRNTTGTIALSGGIVNGGTKIAGVAQYDSFALKHLGSLTFDFI
jgi:sugar lactone lactonase YvrE